MQVTLEYPDDTIELFGVKDEDPEVPGVQATVFAGRAQFGVKSKIKSGTAVIKAKAGSVESSLPVFVVLEVRLLIEREIQSVVADGSTAVPLLIKVVDETGDLLRQVNGRVRLTLADDSFGTLRDEYIDLAGGQGRTIFTVANKAGVATILALTGGPADQGALHIPVVAGPPSFVTLTSEIPTLSPKN